MNDSVCVCKRTIDPSRRLSIWCHDCYDDPRRRQTVLERVREYCRREDGSLPDLWELSG